MPAEQAILKIRRYNLLRFISKVVKKAELKKNGSLKPFVQSIIAKCSQKGAIIYLSELIAVIGTTDDAISLDSGPNTTSGARLDNPAAMSLKVNSEAIAKLRFGSFRRK